MGPTASLLEMPLPHAAPTDLRPGRRSAWALSAIVTVGWALAVVALGLIDRVADQWEAAVTMLFGSFLAGASPEGGGAVAFPVLTKVLHVAAPTARSFGLFIQAVGMSMAVVAIVLNQRPIHRRAVTVATVAAVMGFGVTTIVGNDVDAPFAPSIMGVGFVKATFSIVLATTSVLMVRHLRHDDAVDHRELAWTRRLDIGLVVAAVAGGALSAVTGTGANILVFLFLVVLADVSPKVALPTAIVVMAAVSVVGLITLGIGDGHLAVEVIDDRVVQVGGLDTDLPAAEADLLGMWLAAVPIVVWGAPLGSLVASRVSESVLVRFVALLAAVEVATTIVLVEELRTDAVLAAYLILGLAVVPSAVIALRSRRHAVFAAEPMG
ncbi:MAG: sulfite exporter TauE/SafE family protein [Actinomycetota bacterium]